MNKLSLAVASNLLFKLKNGFKEVQLNPPGGVTKFTCNRYKVTIYCSIYFKRDSSRLVRRILNRDFSEIFYY